MKTLQDFNFKNQKAIIRVDFNVPLDDNFHVTDTTRIEAAKPTIDKILADGGSVILMSHLGRPKGVEAKYSLKHIVKTASEILGTEVLFASDCVGEIAETAAKVQQVLPSEVQTGPAIRKDEKILQKHLDFLKEQPPLQEIYRLLSQSIVNL